MLRADNARINFTSGISKTEKLKFRATLSKFQNYCYCNLLIKFILAKYPNFQIVVIIIH